MKPFAICALLLVSLCPRAAAQPIRHQVDLTFADGGEAHGYLVHDRMRQRLTDYAIAVSGGAEVDFPPFVYDPTTSLGLVNPFLPELIEPAIYFLVPDSGGRRLWLGYTEFGGLTLLPTKSDEDHSGGTPSRRAVAGAFTRIAAPVITLKVNARHPAGRVVTSTGDVSLTLDLAPGGWTGGALDWYWAFALNGNVYWVTGSGLSATPASLGSSAPFFVEGAALFTGQLASGTTLTAVIFAMDGDTLVSADAITAVVGAPASGGG
jgi:hypothetical protein